MVTLPSNSTITVDGFTITSHASAILLWRSVLTKAIRAGEVGWIQLSSDDGAHSVLVTPSSKIQVFIANADLPGEAPQSGGYESSNGNLPAWVKLYVDADSADWGLVRALGMEGDVASAPDRE